MLILGRKYTFTKLEIDQLNKKFGQIKTLDYKNKDSKDAISQIEQTLINSNFTIIVLNTKAKVDDEIIKYLTNLKFNYDNIDIIDIEHFLEKYLFKCYIPEDNNDLHYLDDIRGLTFFQRMQKKIVDSIAIIGLLPIFLALKPLIKRKIQQQSPGSLYFKQTRVGLRNKEFECIKFRSMHEHDTDSNIRIATKHDDRVFEFGKFLRKTRIDEIPQVFNIIKGEMSLVGPRAEWDKLVEEYEKEIPYYNQRHIVRPGITGWAQVMFAEGRNKDDTKQKLMYDLYYIKHWNLLLEMKVICKTILVVLGKKGV